VNRGRAWNRTSPGRLLRLALAAWMGLAGATMALHAQSLEVQASSGTVEALLPELGWRQAVVGRPLPADTILTSWIDSTARAGIGDSTCSVGPLTHLRVVAVSDQLVQLALQAGSVTVETGGLSYEIEFRGVTIHLQGGAASVSDGVLTLTTATAVVSGVSAQPLPLKPGAVLDLLARNEGPVFRTDSR